MRLWAWLFLCSLTFPNLSVTDSRESAQTAAVPGDRVSKLTRELGRHVMPDASGAMGLNKTAYFHVRFQRGVHHLADWADDAREAGAAEAFVRALEYAFAHQETNGGFSYAVPASLGKNKKPSDQDLASGVAFFAASAADGWMTLRRSGWFEQNADLAPLRQRVDALAPGMKSMLAYMNERAELLRAADALAPNRLMIDALAFAALARVANDQRANQWARIFLDDALKLQHPDGYFIEGGGYDSSYNAVVCAYGYRLLRLDETRVELRQALRRSLAWQRTRVDNDGEISVAGNARVGPGGEQFLGRTKQVSVVEVVDAFVLAEKAGESGAAGLAEKIFLHYARRSPR